MREGQRRKGRYAITLTLLLILSPCALALNPALDIRQYAHTPYRISDGFAKGFIYSIAQTPDGYLWLGTELGVLRFDGVRTLPPPDSHFPNARINRLLAARDGTLWIGGSKGLASWKDGKLAQYADLADVQVGALLEDREGTLWAGGFGSPTGRLCAVQKSGIQCYGEDGRFGQAVNSLYEYQGGLWAGTSTGLWLWRPGPPHLYPMPGSITSMIEGDNGALWIATPDGIRQLVNGKAEAYTLAGGGEFRPQRMLRDHDGGLWIATVGQGLIHCHRGRMDVFASADGLSDDRVLGLFEDREGNIWAATYGGLDRFREIAVSTISGKQGLSGHGTVATVLATKDGSVWFGTGDGLDRWNNGQITIYRKRSSSLLTHSWPRPAVRQMEDDGLPDNSIESLFEDHSGRIWVATRGGVAYFEAGKFVPVASMPASLTYYSLTEENSGNLWIGDQNLGLLHLGDDRLVEQIPWATLGHKDSAIPAAADKRHGGLWLGFYQGGLVYFKDGRVQVSYTVAQGLGAGHVNDLRFDGDGTLWAATEGGLSRLKNGRIATLTSKSGLPCDAVQWSIEDDAQSLWLKMPCGLVRVTRAEWEAWRADPTRTVRPAVFDSSDGVRSFSTAGSLSPRVAKSADGKLWFPVYDGVSVVDPRHLPHNDLRPPVNVEKIIADRKTYAGGAKLPPLVRDVEIDFSALSFVAPEKNRFRYKLEGRDPDWVDAGTRRQAFYNDLPPRSYRFRVMASNNDGVWNEAGASMDFSVDPAYYQIVWFRAGVVVAFCAVLWGLHRYRLHQMAQVFDARMEARVGERTRIARELHDTLLQSFQGVLLKFSAIKYMMRNRPEEAEETLERYIIQARAAITEGRDAVQGLRSSTVVANDLARAITTFGEGLCTDQAGPDCPEFRVYVEGKSKDLPPLVRDEVYKIACECLRNAFGHAQARRIEAQIRYEPRQFRLQVVDNGKGIDPAVLSAGGCAGHHGLPGIRERAELTGGKLSVWSQPNSGTEIELTIPASIAYPKSKPPAAKTATATNAGKRVD